MNDDDDRALDALLERVREDLPEPAALAPMRRALGIGESAPVRGTGSTVVKVALVVGAVVLLGGLVFVLESSVSRPAPSIVISPRSTETKPTPMRGAWEPEPSEVPTEVETPPEPPRPVAEESARDRHPAARPREVTQRRDTNELEPEAAILLRAQRALASGDLASAERALTQHREIHPDGLLVEERESLSIQAAIRRGDRDRAREMLDRFERERPRSVHHERLERLLSAREISTHE
jgi:hypothetical protein